MSGKGDHGQLARCGCAITTQAAAAGGLCGIGDRCAAKSGAVAGALRQSHNREFAANPGRWLIVKNFFTMQLSSGIFVAGQSPHGGDRCTQREEPGRRRPCSSRHHEGSAVVRYRSVPNGAACRLDRAGRGRHVLPVHEFRSARFGGASPCADRCGRRHRPFLQRVTGWIHSQPKRAQFLPSRPSSALRRTRKRAFLEGDPKQRICPFRYAKSKVPPVS
jgi:hypothetical protein